MINMKFIIIGLGIFGSSLAEKLTSQGHEVIGVDKKIEKVDLLKDRITHTIALDSTDSQAVSQLPLKDTDVVIVAIGENEGANIITTAQMKQYGVKRLVSRAVSPLHQTVLETMGVDLVVHPESETAERWAKKLNLKGVIDSFELADQYNIIEAKLPNRYIGKRLKELDLRKKFNILVLNTIKPAEEKNIFGVTRKVNKIHELASANTMIEEDDIVVLYGKLPDIKNLLKED